MLINRQLFAVSSEISCPLPAVMAGTGEESTASSPKSPRLKFLCSFGGKILPRPSDGHLKYVGGETRVVAVPRSVTFSELREKIAGVCDGEEVVIKYQLSREDLDALVSVTTDEDLLHMLDEYDRQDLRSPPSAAVSSSGFGGGGAPRLRVFLFPTNSKPPPTGDHPHPHPHPHAAQLEQRYIDAVNCVTRTPTKGPTIIGDRPIFTVSSPTSTASEVTGHDLFRSLSGGGGAVNTTGGGRFPRLQGMHRAHSSPSLHKLGNQQQQQQQQAHGSARMYGYEIGHVPRNALLHQFPPPSPSSAAVGKMRYFSPVRFQQQECGGGGVCRRCGHVEEGFCSPRNSKGEGFFSRVPARQRMWE